jgi:hypothetical protein
MKYGNFFFIEMYPHFKYTKKVFTSASLPCRPVIEQLKQDGHHEAALEVHDQRLILNTSFFRPVRPSFPVGGSMPSISFDIRRSIPISPLAAKPRLRRASLFPELLPDGFFHGNFTGRATLESLRGIKLRSIRKCLL